MRRSPTPFLAGLLPILFFLLGLTHPDSARAMQNPAAQALGPLDRLARQVERLETARTTGVTEQEFKETLEQANKEIGTFLDVHPDDVDANILLVRLARLQYLQGGGFVSGKDAEEELSQAAKEERVRMDELAGRLDHALAHQPNRADAYYWKARIYGVQHPAILNSRFTQVSLDLQEAIRNSRRATELAPDNVLYREALAQYLILDKKFDDAAEVMRAVAGGRHIISLLLADRKAFPVPDRAVFDVAGTASFADMEMMNGVIHDYPELRIQQFVANAPATEVMAFYQKVWPGIKFFEQKREKNEPGEMQGWYQVLRGPSNSLQPLATKSEFEKEMKSGSNPDGLALSLIEIRQTSDEKRKDLNGIPVGDVFSVLTVLDGRLAPSR